METIKRVMALNDLTDNITKDNVYGVKYIHYGQTVYYDIIDDCGVINTCGSSDFIDTKQVVIKGLDNYYGLLTPYWLVKYINRKYNKQLYIYDTKKDEESYFLLQESANYNDFCKSYDECYSYKEIKGKVKCAEDFILRHELLDEISREDEILIQIAKEVNNEEYLKIIDIPFDVDYYISQYDDGSECVEENHRKWY